MASHALYSGFTFPIIYAYNVNAAATQNYAAFSPSVPTRFNNGLFVNASGTATYVVTYIPMGYGRS